MHGICSFATHPWLRKSRFVLDLPGRLPLLSLSCFVDVEEVEEVGRSKAVRRWEKSSSLSFSLRLCRLSLSPISVLSL